jgi:hypothetical protein
MSRLLESGRKLRQNERRNICLFGHNPWKRGPPFCCFRAILQRLNSIQRKHHNESRNRNLKHHYQETYQVLSLGRFYVLRYSRRCRTRIVRASGPRSSTWMINLVIQDVRDDIVMMPFLTICAAGHRFPYL